MGELDGRIAIIVADVVGHGVAAALLMARLAAEVRVMLATEPDPTAAFIRLNELLVRDGVPDRFVTSVMTVLEPDRHKITIVNAGHMPPLIYRSNIKVVYGGNNCGAGCMYP